MEKAVKKSRLRTEFIKFVTVTFLGVIVLSVAVIIGCYSLREGLLLPNSDKVYLNWAMAGSESSPQKPNYGFSMLTLADPDAVNPFYTEDSTENRCFVLSRFKLGEGDVVVSITRVYNSPEALSPNNQILYHGCGVSMVLLPVLFALAGVLICGFAFYERKLKRPIETLFEATEKIAAQDLDFSVDYRSEDELGVLCSSFEQMRKALQENNEKMWGMLAERRQLQASVAHDLRNPIAIIEGHTEYLKMNISKNSKEGLSVEKTVPVLDNISSAAKRLEHYTDSIRNINRIEELDIKRDRVDFDSVFEEVEEDFGVIPEQRGIAVKCTNAVGRHRLNLDKQALFRILENLVGNAVRYAENEIGILFVYDRGNLVVTVSNDGCGFSEGFIKNQKKNFVIRKSDGEHSGIGLTVCGILAKKHGGDIACGNSGKGAFVKVVLNVD